MAGSFETRLREGPPLVADGGMGSLLTAAVPRLRTPEEANLRAPEAVVSLHVSFINAGAELIETNSFGANRHKLASHFLEEEFERINTSAVKLAREARELTGRDVFIGGAIGPLGEATPPSERHELFSEQAAILEDRGSDLFILETFYDLDELEAAVTAVRSVSSLPIMALLTFDEQAETLTGLSASAAADRLAELGLAAIGANHGAGLLAALTALRQMQDRGCPLAALPNIGLASLLGGKVIYPHASPEYFAEFAAHARELGARVIGGCCGTTPTEIAAIRDAIDADVPARFRLDVNEAEVAAALGEDLRETRLAQALRSGEFVVSVQLDPPLGGSSRGLIEVARTLESSGLVRFVDVNDNATARAGISALIVASAIERASNLETIPHLTTRDSTVLGLESLLLGMHSEGVRNVLAITGDPPEVGDYPGSRGVYEIDSIGLTRLIAALNLGEDFNGRPIDAPTSFFAGVAVQPTADNLELEAERFQQKIAAGARFAMTQIVFDLDVLDRFAEFVGGWPVPVLAGIFPVTSYRLALRLDNEVPGIDVPRDLQDALNNAGPKAAEVGMRHAKRLIEQARERCEGVYVVAPYRKPTSVLELLG
jgi:methionine synthase I (cobalamin-dependent)/5,10-methylenetetrahydrofolate reductase